ncbi:MAG: hypothetical protein VXZ82_21115 [Planctomycetota bacterium]|nr:hypothetical protein [Planctomycetota bacterium]
MLALQLENQLYQHASNLIHNRSGGTISATPPQKIGELLYSIRMMPTDDR